MSQLRRCPMQRQGEDQAFRLMHRPAGFQYAKPHWPLPMWLIRDGSHEKADCVRTSPH